MIVISAFIVGAVSGALRARTKGGNRLDMAQYAVIFGIIFAIFGLFVTIFIGRAL